MTNYVVQDALGINANVADLQFSYNGATQTATATADKYSYFAVSNVSNGSVDGHTVETGKWLYRLAQHGEPAGPGAVVGAYQWKSNWTYDLDQAPIAVWLDMDGTETASEGAIVDGGGIPFSGVTLSNIRIYRVNTETVEDMTDAQIINYLTTNDATLNITAAYATFINGKTPAAISGIHNTLLTEDPALVGDPIPLAQLTNVENTICDNVTTLASRNYEVVGTHAFYNGTDLNELIELDPEGLNEVLIYDVHDGDHPWGLDNLTGGRVVKTGTEGDWTYTYAKTGQELSAMGFGQGGNDEIIGTEEADFIAGGAGNDGLYGLDGNDVLVGGEGNDELYGGEGDDTLVAGAGNDVLVGGEGDDTIIGGEGAKTIVLTEEDFGNDTIINVKGGATVDTVDTLKFYAGAGTTEDPYTGSYFNSLEFDKVHVPATLTEGAHTDLVITSASGTVTLKGYFGKAATPEGAEVATDPDTVKNLKIQALYLDGETVKAGTYTVVDNAVIDVEVDQPYTGSDVYRERILVADDATMDGTTKWSTTYGTYIAADASKDITETAKAGGKYAYSRVNEYTGKSQGVDSLVVASAKTEAIIGGEGNGVLVADATGTKLYGDEGNDLLLGGDGNDELYSLDGHDVLKGGAGNDVIKASLNEDGVYIEGGAGNDEVTGGSGKDIIITGAGADVIDLSEGGADEIRIADGTVEGADATRIIGATADDVLKFTDAEFKDLTFGRALQKVSDTVEYDNLVITIDRGEKPADTVIVQDFFSFTNSHPVDKIVVKKGTGTEEISILEDTIDYTDYVGPLSALGDKRIVVNADTYKETSTSTWLYGSKYNEVIENVAVPAAESAAVITASDGDDKITGPVTTADGGYAILSGGLGDDEIVTQGAGVTTAFGNEGDDKFTVSGTGKNHLYGDEGDDTFDVKLAGSTNFVVGGSGNDTIQTSNKSTSYIEYTTEKPYGVDTVTTTITEADANANAILYARYSKGGIVADPEGDTVVGTTKFSDLYFTRENDGTTYSNDLTISSAYGTTVLKDYFATATTLTDKRLDKVYTLGTDGKPLATTISADAVVDVDVIAGQNFQGTLMNEYVYGTKGADVIKGGAGDDTLVAGAGNDVVNGEEGDDTIILSGGKNRVVFEKYAAADSDVVIGATRNDELDFSAFKLTDLTFTQDGDDLVITAKDGGVLAKTVTIQDHFASKDRVDRFWTEENPWTVDPSKKPYSIGKNATETVVIDPDANPKYNGADGTVDVDASGFVSPNDLKGVTFTTGSGDNTFIGSRFNDTVNGKKAASLDVAEAAGKNKVTGGTGNDNYVATGTASGSADLGDGVNYVSLGATVGDHKVTTGKGNDTYDVLGGYNTISDKGGNNNMTIGGGINKATTGAGDDVWTIGGGVNTINSGKSTGVGEHGYDDFTITAGESTIKTGGDTKFDISGASIVNITNSGSAKTTDDYTIGLATAGSAAIKAGAGDDSFTIKDTNRGITTIDGGAGTDVFTVEGAVADAHVYHTFKGGAGDDIYDFSALNLDADVLGGVDSNDIVINVADKAGMNSVLLDAHGGDLFAFFEVTTTSTDPSKAKGKASSNFVFTADLDAEGLATAAVRYAGTIDTVTVTDGLDVDTWHYDKQSVAAIANDVAGWLASNGYQSAYAAIQDGTSENLSQLVQMYQIADNGGI